MTRVLRFGNGVLSLPLWLRLAITAPFVLLGIGLLQSFITDAMAGRPNAAFARILIGLLTRVAWLLLPSLWQPTAEWERREQSAALLERQLKDALDDTVRHHVGLTSDPDAPPRRIS